LAALDEKKSEKGGHGEFGSECPVIVGRRIPLRRHHERRWRIYPRTFINTYSRVAFAELYERKTPITAADLLNDPVLPFFDAQNVKLYRVPTDRDNP
jgi:hypothetical protein